MAASSIAQRQKEARARREGAKAALAAMASIDAAVSTGDSDGYHQIDPTEAARIMIEGAGEKLSPRMEGYLAALGEYIGQICEGWTPNIEAFQPLAAMTEKKAAAVRDARIKCGEEVEYV